MAFDQAVAVQPISLQPMMSRNVAVDTFTAANAANGNRFVANRNTILRVRNTGGATVTVTIYTVGKRYGLSVANVTFTVPPTTGDMMWSGFERIFHQNRFQEVWVTFSSVSGVSLQVIQPL